MTEKGKASMSENISRRSFVKASALAGTSAMLAACGGNSGGSAGGDGAAKKALYFGQSNPKEGLDMQKSTNSGESAIADSIVESPLRWTEDNVLVTTFLTEIPTFEADGVTLPCEIKEGVKFHDGTPLTAADVKYSFERMFTPATAAKSTYMYDMLAGAQEMLAGERDNLDEASPSRTTATSPSTLPPRWSPSSTTSASPMPTSSRRTPARPQATSGAWAST